jgi:hypothetical protein
LRLIAALGLSLAGVPAALAAPASQPAGGHSLPTWPARPDPPPLTTSGYLDLDLKLAKGKLSVLGIRKGRFPGGARRLPRFRGTYVVLLHSHGALLDVVRFTFPLTGGAGKRTRAPVLQLDQSLARGVSARTRVRVPFDSRVTRILVRDLVTNGQVEVDLRAVRPTSVPFSPPNLRTSSFSAPGKPRTPPAKKKDNKKNRRKKKRRKRRQPRTGTARPSGG